MLDSKSQVVELRRWTAKRKASLVLDVLKGKTTLAEASREFDLTPSEIEEWMDEAQRGMENALRTKPKDVHQQYEGRIRDLQAKVGELVLENDVLKKLEALQNSHENK